MKRDLSIVVAFCLALTLPFINKAFHIDDAIYLRTALNILQNPLHPNWGEEIFTGQKRNLFIHNNPPLTAYYMAIVILLTGKKNELTLHLSFIPFALLSAIGMYLLARRFGKGPLPLTLTFIACPAFLITSHGLMTDGVMLSLFLLSLVAYIYGVDKQSNHLLLSSGLLTGLAIMTKYSALSLLLLLPAYSLTMGKGLKDFWKVLPLALAPFLGWCLHNLYFYGSIHAFSFGKLAQQSPLGLSAFSMRNLSEKALANLSFLSGIGLFPLAFLWGLLDGKLSKASFGLFLVLGFSLSLWMVKDYSPGQMALLSFLLTTGLLTLLKIGYQGLSMGKEQLFLALWAWGMLLPTVFLFPFASARFLLPILPALFLFWQRQEKVERRARGWLAWATVASTLILGLTLALADYELAGLYRSFAREAKRLSNQGKLWFTGEAGLRPYMEVEGHGYLLSDQHSLPLGEVVVLPQTCHKQALSPTLMGQLEPMNSMSYKGTIPLVPLSYPAHAGFYAHTTGLLPYGWAMKESLETFDIYRVVERGYFIKNFYRAEVKAPGPEHVGIRAFTINGERRAVLFVHPPSEVTYSLIPEVGTQYVEPLQDEPLRLSFGMGLDPLTWSEDKGDGVVFEIYLHDGKDKRLLFSQYIVPKSHAEDRRWNDVELEIRPEAGSLKAITFATQSGPAGNSDYDWAGFSDPRLVGGGGRKPGRGEDLEGGRRHF